MKAKPITTYNKEEMHYNVNIDAAILLVYAKGTRKKENPLGSSKAYVCLILNLRR